MESVGYVGCFLQPPSIATMLPTPCQLTPYNMMHPPALSLTHPPTMSHIY
eukprot:m.51895 g.51895  ORF g.51895 m.51895 type:complete len:50 (-) comp7339_c0_seq2:3202-3351(-)